MRDLVLLISKSSIYSTKPSFERKPNIVLDLPHKRLFLVGVMNTISSNESCLLEPEMSNKELNLELFQVEEEAIDTTDRCRIIVGDARDVVKELSSEYFDCVVTSPPYWGLRDYGVGGQIGAESKVDDYINDLVVLFREIKRTLKKDGTLWINIGDSYTSGGRTWRDKDDKNKGRAMSYRPDTPEGLKPKDLIGVPWKLAFALQADGWYLRSDIIWNKPNCQPESVRDRPTRSHEYIFLFSKEKKYYYDIESMKEPSVDSRTPTRNRRTVWNINTEPYPGSHFAVYPRAMAKLCIMAGSRPNGRVLDPFFGSGTTGVVCNEVGRECIGIELSSEYAELAKKRLLSRR